MTGGRLYGHSLEKVIPGFAESAPIERRIVRERISSDEEGSLFTVEYDGTKLCAPEGESYSVLRGKFDRWLAEQAEEQGAMLVYGVRVDDVILREGKVCGVIAGDEEMEADLVILADGVNSLLSQKIGLKQQARQDQAAVGVKEVIGLKEETINQRFQLASGEGIACMFHDWKENCDGFLYTNKDSVSVGVTMPVDNIDNISGSVPEMLEEFKKRPEIEELLTGGNLLEYSAHLIPEGGMDMIPELYGDGVLVAGDAAALCANLGFTLRGMDLAIESGRLAAEAALAAKARNDYSAKSLSDYQAALESSFVMPCIKGVKACQDVVKAGTYRENAVKAFGDVMAKKNIR